MTSATIQEIAWKPFPDLVELTEKFCLFHLAGYLYKVGGATTNVRFQDSVHRIRPDGTLWESRASFPVEITRYCGVVDEENERLFIMGGKSKHVSPEGVFVYEPNEDTWYHHSDLPKKVLAVLLLSSHRKMEPSFFMCPY